MVNKFELELSEKCFKKLNELKAYTGLTYDEIISFLVQEEYLKNNKF